MGLSLKLANVIFCIHVMINFVIPFGSVVACILYFIDYVLDTKDAGVDNIIISVYLLFSCPIQILQALIIGVKTPLKKFIYKVCILKSFLRKLESLSLIIRSIFILASHMIVIGFLIYVVNNYSR